MSNRKFTIAPTISLDRERVTVSELQAAGIDLGRDFPGATEDDFRKYPVLSEGGWFIVIKHQPTLQTVTRVPWGLFGPIQPMSAGLIDGF
ncbi:MAG: hypothetical protein EOP24_28000 [Hyphomicrobiales bacterium]|nr:MAG: hypothetical protein EOP24_28000 [Hyphomicrobiales bacterium]